ncbi:myo-inosose-2 dehydratase [Salinisphaera sp. USBA-960]|uniref:myo-inosose-2 dehydratase n=1 Tax=Salinisphaera orenii TaxID=856731 RepID=UPI000DBE4EB7|nr:myo-inosose-2 dehydratase [Salifodinibacter halophilus]NNC25666.1 myo-inosose-2 dehydratase [Salifodinibacter halophilus]
MTIQLGVNPLLWTNDDLPMLGDETLLTQCLAEAKRAGYEGVEMGRKFPATVDELGPLIQHEDLALASGWYSANLLERDAEAEIEAMQDHLALMKATGVTAMVFCETTRCVHLDRAMPVSRRPRLTESDWRLLAPRLEVVADYLAGEGVQMAFHHHMGTMVQSTGDVAQLMDSTGDNVGLLFDTGHCRLAGGDPLDWLGRWSDRMVHVHCKDVREAVLARSRNRNASFLDSVVDGVFTIPGDGDLDFNAILRRLSRSGYNGWLIAEAEQDPAVAPSWPLAQRSYQYLRDAAQRNGLSLATAA